MPMIRRAALATAAVLFSALPAAAQTAATTTDQGTGNGLLYVWGWILVVGIIVFIVGTSIGVRGGR